MIIIFVSRSILHKSLQFLEYRFSSAGKLVALAKFLETTSLRDEDNEFIFRLGLVTDLSRLPVHGHPILRDEQNSICCKQ